MATSPPETRRRSRGTMRRGRQLAACWLLALVLALLARHVSAQGLSRDPSAKLGADESFSSLKMIYKSSRGFKQAYKLNGRSACSTQSASLCSSVSSDDDLAALMVATSPSYYSARDNELLSPVRDQGNCLACTSFALVSAAEAAISSALKRSARNKQWSVQDLHFCSGIEPGEVRSCRSSSLSVKDAIRRFIATQNSRRLVLETCLPYVAPMVPPDYDLCSYRCKDSDPDLDKGEFRYVQINTPWEIQAHIRQWGGVITRLDIYSDFREFFKQKPNGVYQGPGKGATLQEPHAVLLVGYDNTAEVYTVKNSWSPAFGEHGLFRVAYKATATGIGAPEDTYGLSFRLKAPLPLPFTLYPSANKGGCWWFEPPPNSWPSGVAQQFGIKVSRLLLDNTDRIHDLDSAIEGSILLCGVTQDIIERTKGQGAAGGRLTPAAEPAAAPPAPAPDAWEAVVGGGAAPAPAPPARPSGGDADDWETLIGDSGGYSGGGDSGGGDGGDGGGGGGGSGDGGSDGSPWDGPGGDAWSQPRSAPAPAPEPGRSGGGGGGGGSAAANCEDAPPQPVQGLRVASNTQDGGGRASMQLSWEAPQGLCARSYRVTVYSVGPKAFGKAASGSVGPIDPKMKVKGKFGFVGTAGQVYMFEVAAANNAGASQSASVTAAAAGRRLRLL
ncbi:MAG: hypothetical protein J3K34DRAFT_521446 [Monoraphidium minutum]|nr:MAG: hypothetical protein J3K34DRAFT_521446 [Monoraphidium minutum]